MISSTGGTVCYYTGAMNNTTAGECLVFSNETVSDLDDFYLCEDGDEGLVRPSDSHWRPRQPLAVASMPDTSPLSCRRIRVSGPRARGQNMGLANFMKGKRQ